MDALDLASLIELEAKKRYTEFAESLGSRGVDDAGAVFRSMAINENKHCEEIAERRTALEACPLFEGLPKEALDELAHGASLRSVRAAETIIREGEEYTERELGPVRFVPLIGRAGWPALIQENGYHA